MKSKAQAFERKVPGVYTVSKAFSRACMQWLYISNAAANTAGTTYVQGLRGFSGNRLSTWSFRVLVTLCARAYTKNLSSSAGVLMIPQMR